MATLVYCSLSGMALAYLTTAQLVSDEGRHQLRSVDLRTCRGTAFQLISGKQT